MNRLTPRNGGATVVGGLTSTLHRYLPLVLTLCTGVAISVVAFYLVRNDERAAARDAFEWRAYGYATAVQKSIDRHLEIINSIGSLFVASGQVERGAFRVFVENHLAHHESIQALEWIPRVPHDQRAAYEAAARRDGLPGFQFTEHRSQGEMARAGERAEYYPVYYVEPLKGNGPAVGYDLGSNPVRLAALEQARDTGTMVISGRITLVQETGSQHGVLIFQPAYRPNMTHNSVEQRREHLIGFGLGVFRIGDMLEGALRNLRRDDLAFQLYDETMPGAEELVDRAPGQSLSSEESARLQLRIPLDVPGRQWALLFSPTPAFLAAHSVVWAWVVLAGGFGATALLGLYLLGAVRHTTRVQTLAGQLAETNEDLINEVTERERAQHALRESEQKFHSMADAAQDGIVLMNSDGVIAFWNKAAERAFGYSSAEALGKDGHLLLAPARYRDTARKSFARFAATGHGPMVGRTLEVDAMRSDGSEFPAEISIAAVKLGSQWNAAGIVRDITERKQSEEKTNKINRALKTISRCNRVLIHAQDEARLLHDICRVVVEQGGYGLAWVGYPEAEAKDVIHAVAQAGDTDGYIDTLETRCHGHQEQHCFGHQWSTCPVGEAMRSNQPCVVRDIVGDGDAAPWRGEAARRGYASIAALPLRENGTVFGVLSIYAMEPDAFNTEEMDLLGELTGDLSYGVATLRTRDRHRQAEDRINYLALHDPLTGLPNRAMLMQSVESLLGQAERQPWAIAVLFVDLDQFKLINDTLGREAGDELLRQVAERLLGLVRKADVLAHQAGDGEQDLLARQAGDEFIVLLANPLRRAEPGTPAAETDMGRAAALVARRLIDAMQRPYLVQGQETYIGATIGIGLFPDDADDAAGLLQNAENAMYRAKELGRGNYCFYSRELSERQQQRHVLENRLHKAIEENQFVLHYQPIIDLSEGCMVGVEALLRWRPTQNELVFPVDFIPVAEESGLIIPIGDWVLNAACRQLGRWRGNGARLYVAVNLSARQFWQGNVIAQVWDAISRTRIPSDALELEVTESAMIHDPVRMEAMLRECASRRLRIALDDFGTGYSSLSRLKDLPIATLKIDDSFVSGLPGNKDSLAIVTTIVQLARNLGMRSLAEGIETAEQWRCLYDLGCNFGQGFYFSPAVAATEIDALLETKRRWTQNSAA